MASKRSNPWGWLAGNPSESVESSAEDEAVAVGGKSDVSYEDKVVQIQKMIDVMKATSSKYSRPYSGSSTECCVCCCSESTAVTLGPVMFFGSFYR